MKTFVQGISPLGPSRKVKAAIRKAVKDLGSDPQDAEERFQRAFCSRFAIGSDRLLLGSSVSELLRIVMTSCQPGRLAIVGPAGREYEMVARSAGIAVTRMQSGATGSWPSGIDEVADMSESGDMMIVANPNRITGRAAGTDDLAALAGRLARKGCVLLVDESLIGLDPGEVLPGAGAASHNVIVLRTTGLYYGLIGLELACAVSSAALIAALREHPRCPRSRLAIAAAHAAIRDAAFARESREFVARERLMFLRKLRKVPGVTVHESDSSVFLIEVPVTAGGILRLAAREGLAVEPCGMSADGTGQLLSVSVMRHEQNLQLVRIVQRCCDAGDGSRG